MKLSNKQTKLLLAASVALLVCTAATVYASGGSGGESNSLSPAKLKDLGWRAMNFAALVVILVKFLSKPIANAMNSRREAIATQFEALESRRSEVEKTYKEYEAKIGKIDSEVSAILEAAKKQAEAEKDRIIAEAGRAADDIRRKAEISIQHEMSLAQRRLRVEVAEQAAAMAEELIRKNLTDTDQAKLVEDYLEKVGAL